MPPQHERPDRPPSNFEDEIPYRVTHSPSQMGSTPGRDDQGQVQADLGTGDFQSDMAVVEVQDDDDEEMSAADSGPLHTGNQAGEASVQAGEASEPLLGLHPEMSSNMSKIRSILQAKVSDSYVRLGDVPDAVDWNEQQYLSGPDGRALVIVAFGSLRFVHMQFGRMILPTLSVSVELLRDSESESLQNIIDLAEPRHEFATRHLRTFRAAHDEHARFRNVFDCTHCTRGDQEGRRCGINEFATDDFVRVVMRCLKVVDEDNGRVRVQFKLRRLDLLVPVSRDKDIRL